MFMYFKGTIIEESLADKLILKSLRITDTRVEKVTVRHKNPLVKAVDFAYDRGS